jgi:hypothetical protein
MLSLFLLAACDNPQGPVRSPSVDYPPPAVQTSDGQVVGADQTPPGEHIQRGPQAGTQGVKTPGPVVEHPGTETLAPLCKDGQNPTTSDCKKPVSIPPY